MFPLTIKTGDFLIAGFAGNTNSAPLLITNVVKSVVNNMNSYAVTAGGNVYTCTAANCTIQEKTVNIASGSTGSVDTWVLGA